MDHYIWRMEVLVHSPGDPAALARFAASGWVLTEDPDGPTPERLRAWADDLARFDEGTGVLQYREETARGPVLCRSEHFVEVHPELRRYLTSGTLLDTAGRLLGEPAVLYKEKLNHKLPGGAGYSPHQDAPAYRFVEVHVSCLVAIDDATVANGCLEVVSGGHDRVWPQDERGCVRADVVDSMVWEPVEVRAGQTLWFHSRTPHRSGPNRSSSPRRALYPTYNAAAEGDLRDGYYRRKADELAAVGGSRTQVSLIGDFEGTLVG